MTIRVAHSVRQGIAGAVEEIRGALAGEENRLVVYFASPAFDPQELATGMKEAFPGVPVLGCTSSGEIAGGRMLKGSVVAMALDRVVVEDAGLAFVDLSNVGPSLAAAFSGFERRFGQPPREMASDEYVGLVLTDGLSAAEERLLDAIGNRTNVTFVGGSAGDDLKFEKTWVVVGGEARTGASALALLRLKVPFEILKTQSFRVLPGRLAVTRADEATRTVQEFDGRPAAERYAEALGVGADDLPEEFMRHPVGLMVSKDEPFVRSPQQVKGGSVVFYCAIQEGMELSLLEGTDIVRDTRAALDEVRSRGAVSGIINFHCILRTLQLEQEGRTSSYGDLFSGVPAIGFSTYGESYLGHINQTSTMLILR